MGGLMEKNVYYINLKSTYIVATFLLLLLLLHLSVLHKILPNFFHIHFILELSIVEYRKHLQ